jgi:hypothetical protein
VIDELPEMIGWMRGEGSSYLSTVVIRFEFLTVKIINGTLILIFARVFFDLTRRDVKYIRE